MKEYKTGQIRNIALVSHNGAGKTMLVERLLYHTGAISRLGSVQQGTTAMDFEEEEIARHGSISSSLAAIEADDVKLNLIDTPGYIDFVGEVNSALHVADAALVVVEAVSGVEVGTEVVWQNAKRLNRPTVILVNKMDRDTVRVARVQKSISDHLDDHFVNVQIPIGEGPSFEGVVDLITMKAYIGDSGKPTDIPAELVDSAESARAELIEAAAEGDDELIMKFLEGEELTNDEIVSGLQGAMRQGLVTPILWAAGEPGLGITPLLAMLKDLMPSPIHSQFDAELPDGEHKTFNISAEGQLAALVFKTREDTYGKTSYVRVMSGVLESDSRVWDAVTETEMRVGTLQVMTGKETSAVERLNAGDIGSVVKLGEAMTGSTLCLKNNPIKVSPPKQPNPLSSVAIHPESQSDVAKLNSALTRLCYEDPTLSWYTDPATHETILSGMGTTHLEIAIKKAASKFGVHLTTSVPKIPYRETITRKSSAEYTHKKQTGGAGQYARVFLRVEPTDEEFEFGSEIFGGAVSAPFVSATEKGVRAALENGVVAGYPVTGVRVVIFDGKEHPVDSKEIAFQIAGREGFKRAAEGAGPALLEPIYDVEVTIPAEHMGDIMGDLNTRRAQVHGMDQIGTKSIVKAIVPLAEMQTYAADLRSMTQGRGVFSMTYRGYDRVPNHLQGDLVDKLKLESATV